MSDLKMQEEFTIRTGPLWKPADDYIQQMWKSCWQASRECLVIDTRPIRIEADCHVEAGVESVFYAAIDAIHAAGVKTK